MMYSIAAQHRDGSVVDLSQPEFVGEGLNSLADAIDAASDALDYDSKIVAVHVYRGEGYFADHVGTYDVDGWHAYDA